MANIQEAIQERMARPDARAYAEILSDAYQTTQDWEAALAVADNLTGQDYESADEARHYAAEDWREEKAERASGGKRWRNVHNPKLVTYKDPTQGGEAQATEDGGGEKPAQPAAPEQQPPTAPPQSPQQPPPQLDPGAPPQQAPTEEQKAQQFEQELSGQMQALSESLKAGTLSEEEFKARTQDTFSKAVQGLGASRARAVAKAAADRARPVMAKIVAHAANPRVLGVAVSMRYMARAHLIANDVLDWTMRNAMDMATMGSQVGGAMSDIFGSVVGGALSTPSMALWLGSMSTQAVAWLYFKAKKVLRVRGFKQLRDRVEEHRNFDPMGWKRQLKERGEEPPPASKIGKRGIRVETQRRRDRNTDIAPPGGMAEHFSRDSDFVTRGPQGDDTEQSIEIMTLAAHGRAWMLEMAQALGMDQDKVPALAEIEQRLVIQDVQEYDPFGLDEEILDFPPDGAGTPVPTMTEEGEYQFTKREQAEHYEKVAAHNQHNAAALAGLLHGHSLTDTIFVPSARNDRFIRAKVITLVNKDSDRVRGPEAAQRLVIIDDRDEGSGKHSGHDLYFHYGAGDFELGDATPVAAKDNGPERLLELIRQDPPSQEIHDADPMGDASQYARDDYLDSMANAFLSRPK